jgi:hypothetical protein
MPVCLVNSRSVLYQTAVELYVRHRPDGVDYCQACARFGCSARRHGAEVIRAAGQHPALYDSPARRPDATHWSGQPTANLPVYRGI